MAKWAKDKWKLDKAPGQSTISNILKNGNKYMEMTDAELDGKKNRPCAQPELEKALAAFVAEMEAQNQPVNRRSIIAAGKSLRRG